MSNVDDEERKRLMLGNGYLEMSRNEDDGRFAVKEQSSSVR
jgi:hypothetical protein